MRKLQLPPHPEKSHPLFPSNFPLKVEVLSSSPFLKICLEVQPPSRKGKGGGGVHTMLWGTTTKSRLPPWLQILGTTHSPIISNQYLHPIRNELKRLKWSLHILITDRQYQLNFCREKNSDFSCLENWICFL